VIADVSALSIKEIDVLVAGESLTDIAAAAAA